MWGFWFDPSRVPFLGRSFAWKAVLSQNVVPQLSAQSRASAHGSLAGGPTFYFEVHM
jgi:hypothetical protein